MKESEWTVLMEIIKDMFSEVDCVMMPQLARARASNKKEQTVECAERLAEKERKNCRRSTKKVKHNYFLSTLVSRDRAR